MELPHAESRVKSSSSFGPDGQHEYTSLESDVAVGETNSSFGGAALGVAM
jgi:hypothetical protein